ncbi:MAG: hypothetical protein ACJA0Q_000730 [Saprospiraceae bacterium]|jgi:hypothetical protein
MKITHTVIKAGIFASALVLISFSSGPGGSGQQVTGAPGEGTCVNCHSSNTLNSGTGSISATISGGSSKYIPANDYTIVVTGTGSSANKYGFQIVALKTSDDSNAGTFSSGSGTQLATLNSKTYVEHSSASTTGSWSFNWQAPLTDVGDVTFYIAGNSAESPAGTNGDNIYTSTFTLSAEGGTAISQISSNETTLSPNPSTGQTTLSFSLKTPSLLSINIINLSGKNVVQLNDNTLFGSGSHQVSISTTNLNAGIYYVKIQGENYNEVMKLVVN